MKKVIILAVAGILSFVLGTAGIYLAMPTIAPAVVDSTRVRLDSLGLLPATPEVEETPKLPSSADRPLPFDTASAPHDSLTADSLQMKAHDSATEIDVSLQDSLNETTNLVTHLQANNVQLAAELDALKERTRVLESQNADATELSKSLGKLDDRQLAGILISLELDVVEQLYLKASARDRPRLLQNLPPDRAARFVRTLVQGDAPMNEAAEVPDASDQAEEPNP